MTTITTTTTTTGNFNIIEYLIFACNCSWNSTFYLIAMDIAADLHPRFPNTSYLLYMHMLSTTLVSEEIESACLLIESSISV